MAIAELAIEESDYSSYFCQRHTYFSSQSLALMVDLFSCRSKFFKGEDKDEDEVSSGDGYYKEEKEDYERKDFPFNFYDLLF